MRIREYVGDIEKTFVQEPLEMCSFDARGRDVDFAMRVGNREMILTLSRLESIELQNSITNFLLMTDKVRALN